MSTEIIQQRLESYHCKTPLDEKNALKEITQEIALMALSNTPFFKVAEFHGGTALRILYGLQRFSEDLDFALLNPDPEFRLENYLAHLSDTFQAYGYEISISDRTEKKQIVQKQFLKVDSLGKILTLQYPFNRADKTLKIKFEVDTNPPAGASTELKFLTFPLPFSVLTKDKSSSFAGKCHALLCRKYNKGRDWYDFIWYVSQKIPLNLSLLKNALYQQGPWKGQSIDINPTWVINALSQKIKTIDWPSLRSDVQPLMKAHEFDSLQLWQTEFFMSLIEKMQKNIS